VNAVTYFRVVDPNRAIALTLMLPLGRGRVVERDDVLFVE